MQVSFNVLLCFSKYLKNNKLTRIASLTDKNTWKNVAKKNVLKRQVRGFLPQKRCFIVISQFPVCIYQRFRQGPRLF